jgi:excinuclease UvrABC nuclease subunit
VASGQRKSSTYNPTGIAKLPDDKPVVYQIETDGGRVNYVGVAQRGRVQDRLQEHLGSGDDRVPGAKVRIEQFSSIADARTREAALIQSLQPKYNEEGK